MRYQVCYEKKGRLIFPERLMLEKYYLRQALPLEGIAKSPSCWA